MERKRAGDRKICEFNSDPPSPCLVCIGGIHGNEASGVEALQHVAEFIKAESLPLRGQFLGLAGNLPALACGRRYLRHDLNRIWSHEQITRLRLTASDHAADELGEQRALLRLIDELIGTGPREIYFLDLHTTSAGGGPFTIFGDSLRNRDFAQNFPVSMILGLEEQIEGTLMGYLSDMGVVTMGFEAGPHDSPESLFRQEAAIWIALVASGVLRTQDCLRLEDSRAKLSSAATNYPRVLEVRHRQSVKVESRFRMEPGFRNFDTVRKGQLLARDIRGAIHSPENGRILMPLYQSQGSDGFFIVRRIWPFWLTLSRLLRRLPVRHLIPYLPGVRRHPERGHVLLVDPAIAGCFTGEFFHLFGYRKCQPEGDHLVFKRRDKSPLQRAAV